ncbi:hypothetical protein JL108_10300 [Aeromicrobium sp. YIM 150415]|uniref:hypothetical protein n=1 Tax=Aeromicrobium sp. YIM 150415 TaxID=2803912 RepID=UPI001966A633|nr:hypothetical protein [Aeromicrobium sp. YIM 150415]MBM9463837.1 hypothetical protein [Aeromicrobium sp. YIM 150415]
MFAWIFGGVGAIAVIGIPFNEFVYKPLLVEVASSIAHQAGWVVERPYSWSSAAFTIFAVLTVVQVAIPCTAYLLFVAGITRRRRRGASITVFCVAGVLGVLSVMMASIHPRWNPGLGPRVERFAERFDTYDPQVLSVIWRTTPGTQTVLLCCGVLVVVLAMTTWRSGRSRRPRAAWPWILPLPVIALLAIAFQLTGAAPDFAS